MSILLMAHTFDLSDLTAGQKLVLLVMANFANDEGENVYPNHTTIAKKTSLSRRTVIATVQQLADLGYVKLEGKRSNRQNVYSLNVDKISEMCNGFTPGDGSCETTSQNPLMIKDLKDLKDLNLKIFNLKIPSHTEIAQLQDSLYPVMQALATICGRVLADNRQMLGKYAKELMKLGYTPEDVSAFAVWWYAHDWRGKQRQAPIPAQVQEFIGLSKLKKLSDGYLGTNLDHWRAEAKRIADLQGDSNDLQSD